MRTLSLEEVVALHRRVIGQSGGSGGIRDRGALESAVAQPFQPFAGGELYASVVQKPAALGFFLISRFELAASVDEQEQIIMAVASGQSSREEFSNWAERAALSSAS